MKLTGNTIFITGGGSGIGRALAEALHQRGNKVIISGRRKGHLDAIVAANPGMEAVELDITDPQSIQATTAKLVVEHSELNVLINNAGVMFPDQAAGAIDEQMLISIADYPTEFKVDLHDQNSFTMLYETLFEVIQLYYQNIFHLILERGESPLKVEFSHRV